MNPDLIGDLARLAKKYDAKEWKQLARLLEDPQQRKSFRRLLEEMAAVSRKHSPKKRSTKPGRAAKVRESLEALAREDPGRAEMLSDVWDKLRRGDLLPTLGTIRAFAAAIGLKGLGASRRDQAVTELMELLIDLPPEALEEKMRETVVEDRHLGDEYEGWVDLILRRPRDKQSH